MSYFHQAFFKTDRAAIEDLPIGKVVCVGRNYAAHAQELNNPVPAEPLLFMKPKAALVNLAPHFFVPEHYGACHHEAEVALLIGKTLTKAAAHSAWSCVWGVGLALDLTLRDVQDELKAQGAPWEKAKAFDGACPVSAFLGVSDLSPETLGLQCWVNGALRQQGHVTQMLVNPSALLAYMSQFFTLEPGDVVLTGTPAGVGPLCVGDALQLHLQAQDKVILSVDTQVKGVSV